MLFCDLVESTRQSSALDPEEWREVLGGYLDIMARQVSDFGGHVAQYLGDGVMAYFGWPRALGGDAERAVRAGLGILEAVAQAPAVGPALAVRIGIHTGPVVVGEIGAAGSRESLAVGYAANVAARVQSQAPENRLLISPSTHRLVANSFEVVDLGPRTLKGVREPLELFEVVRAHDDRRQDDAPIAATTRLVGRETELDLLDEKFAEAADGRFRAVLVRGEAGIGKSTLVRALKERVAARTPLWLEGKGSPYAQESALLPIERLLSDLVELSGEGGREPRLSSIARALDAVGLDTQESVTAVASLLRVPLVAPYQDLAISPDALRERTFLVLAEWLRRLGETRPVVLLLEDLHWFDGASVDAIARLLEELSGASVLLLATYRPEFDHPWNRRDHTTFVELARFGDEEMRAIVRGVSGSDGLTDEVVGKMVRRAGGIALFGEELAKEAVDSRFGKPAGREKGSWQIPETLQDLLVARLDRLEAAKEMIQVASVIGSEFSLDLLREVAGSDTDALRDALDLAEREDILNRLGSGETNFVFKHALVRDAAYESLLLQSRKELHGRVFRALDGRSRRGADVDPGLAAIHAERAGLVLEATDRHAHAGRRARVRAAYADAAQHLYRALELSQELPESRSLEGLRLRIVLDLGMAHLAVAGFDGYASNDAEAAFSKAVAMAESQGDAARQVPALHGLGLCHLVRGNLEQLEETAGMLGQLSAELGDEVHRAGALLLVGQGKLLRGEFAAASADFESVLEVFDEMDAEAIPAESDSLDVPPRIGRGSWHLARSWLGWAKWFLGRPQEADDLCTRALRDAKEYGEPAMIELTLGHAAILAVLRGDQEKGAELALEFERVAEKNQSVANVVGARLIGAWNRRDDPSAIDEAYAALRLLETDGGRDEEAASPEFYWMLGEVHRWAGKIEEAKGLCTLGLLLSAKTGQLGFDSELRRQRAALLVASDEEGAEAELEAAMQIARRQQARSLELRAATSLARLWRSRGRVTQARELLEPVYSGFSEGFDTYDLREAKNLLQEIG